MILRLSIVIPVKLHVEAMRWYLQGIQRMSSLPVFNRCIFLDILVIGLYTFSTPVVIEWPQSTQFICKLT
jgi:hypothetical protein